MIRCRPGTSEEPDEFYYTEPVYCVVCDMEWDEEHEGDEFTYHAISHEPVCYGRCYRILSESLDDPLIPADDMWIPQYELPFEFEDEAA